MMRVLQVIPSLAGGGGAERSLQALAPLLASRIELHVAFFEPRDHLRYELESSGAVVHALEFGSRGAVYAGLSKLVRDLAPELIHTTLLEADIIGRAAAARRRTPVTSSLANVNYGPEQFRGESRQRSAKRLAVWAADAATARSVVSFHALTDHVADTMSRRLLIPRARITVIPRGRSSADLGRRTLERRRAARASLAVGEAPLIVATARHERQKGLDVLLRSVPAVLESLPGARFVIGGRSGLETRALHDLSRRLGIGDCVQFIGPRDDVPELMCAADVWCVPSRWEGFGGILVEAMALEVPVVASDIPPIREVAGPEPSFDLVRPDEPKALAAGIARTLQDPLGARRRAAAARQRFVDHFSIERTAEMTLEFFLSAVDRSRLRQAD